LETQGKFASLDLSSVFLTLKENLPNVLTTDLLSEAIYRCILIYGRSTSVPTFKGDQTVFKQLQDAPRFFLDVMYMHQKQTNENSPQDIFDKLSDLESELETKTNYFFESSTSLKRFQANFAQFIAHPLQREVQDKFKFATLPKTPIVI